MYKKKIKEQYACGISIAAKVFGGKWKGCILEVVSKGISRPKDIAKAIPDASPRVIEMQIAELLFYGALEKISSDKFPKKTEYMLTELGRSILPILGEMEKWGNFHRVYLEERELYYYD